MGRFAPIASSFRLEVEANLPQNKDENEHFDKPRI